jgi:hypothetical protein
MNDIRSKYSNQAKNLNRTPKKVPVTPENKRKSCNSKLNSDRYKALSKSVTKLQRKDNNRILKNSPSKTKVQTRSGVQQENVKVKVPESTYSTKYSIGGTFKTRSIPSTPISQRKVLSPKKKTSPVKKTRVASPKKKVASPVKPCNKDLEQRFEAHLPSTLSKQQTTKRKSPRKSTKQTKRPELHAPKHKKSPVRVEYAPLSPTRSTHAPYTSPKRRSPRKDSGRISPTRRMIQMKNSYIRNQKKAQKDPENIGKLIYTISPGEAYIVDQEFSHNMDHNELAKRSSELCKNADKERSEMYGDSMMKNHHKKKVFEHNNHN